MMPRKFPLRKRAAEKSLKKVLHYSVVCVREQAGAAGGMRANAAAGVRVSRTTQACA